MAFSLVMIMKYAHYQPLAASTPQTRNIQVENLDYARFNGLIHRRTRYDPCWHKFEIWRSLPHAHGHTYVSVPRAAFPRFRLSLKRPFETNSTLFYVVNMVNNMMVVIVRNLSQTAPTVTTKLFAFVLFQPMSNHESLPFHHCVYLYILRVDSEVSEFLITRYLLCFKYYVARFHKSHVNHTRSKFTSSLRDYYDGLSLLI